MRTVLLRIIPPINRKEEMSSLLYSYYHFADSDGDWDTRVLNMGTGETDYLSNRYVGSRRLKKLTKVRI